MGLPKNGNEWVNHGVRDQAQNTAYPVAADLLHLMFMVLHWAVVGFGKETVGSFQSKKKDYSSY